MKKNYKGKIVAIGLLFLFLGASAALGVSAQQTNSRNTIPPASMARTWADNFDSYTNGQMLDGTPDDGGWKGWDNDPLWGAPVTNVQSRSNPHSVEIAGDADLVREFSGYTSGQWVFTAWQFVPNDFNGISYFILLSDYTDGAGQSNQWAVQIHFDSGAGLVVSEHNDPIELPLIKNQWVELRTEIDLDADWFAFFYNNELLVEKAWTAGPNNQGGGFLDIAAVNLFANYASAVYYDDLSLVPAGGFSCSAGGPYVGIIDVPVQFNGLAVGGTPPYTWEWTFGDGETADIQNPVHTYTEVGVYTVTLTVTDDEGEIATAQTTATINEPAAEIIVESIAGGFGVSAVLKNTGDVDGTGVQWSIKLDGGIILLGKEKTGTVDIPAGESVTIKSMVFGFGKPTITVTADSAEKTATGTVILFFVIGVA